MNQPTPTLRQHRTAHERPLLIDVIGRYPTRTEQAAQLGVSTTTLHRKLVDHDLLYGQDSTEQSE
jgi:DNA-binding protein Fis